MSPSELRPHASPPAGDECVSEGDALTWEPLVHYGDFLIMTLTGDEAGLLYHIPSGRWSITTDETYSQLIDRIEKNELAFYDSGLNALAVFCFSYPDCQRPTAEELIPRCHNPTTSEA